MFEQEYTQEDLDLMLQEAQRHLTQLKYPAALELFARAREIAWKLSVTKYFTELDRGIQRLRDQIVCHAQLSTLAQHWNFEAESEMQLACLQQLEQLLGLISAMNYQPLLNAARITQMELITRLGPGRSQELAQRAVESQDYRLAFELLEGLQFNEDTPAATLFKRVRETLETEISPLLQQAHEYLPQARPLDALGPLQDLRQKYPHCPAWRELWFEAALAQGEFFLERGRQHLSNLRYLEARGAFSDAYRTFSRGAEAYPEAHATQMLLTEAQDLRELSQDMAAAYQLLERDQKMEALRRFDAIYEKLLGWEGQQREYTQQKYELTLMRSRLQEQVQPVSCETPPPEQQTGGDLEALLALSSKEPLTAIKKWQQLKETHPELGSLPPALCQALSKFTLESLQFGRSAQIEECLELGMALCPDEEAFKQIQEGHQQGESQQEAVDQDTFSSDQMQPVERRKLLRALRIAIDEGDFEQGWALLERLEASKVATETLDLYERILQAGSRMVKGRQLLQEGDVEAAVVRFGSAAELVKGLPEADMVAADAQMWLERARAQFQPSFATNREGEIEASVDSSRTRFAEWVLHIDPLIAQARVAFIHGERERARSLFLTALEHIPTSAPEHLDATSATHNGGNES